MGHNLPAQYLHKTIILYKMFNLILSVQNTHLLLRSQTCIHKR